MRYCVAVLVIALIPTIVFGAGFAKGSLFLSKTSVIEGETVLIHAVVSNDSAIAISANVVFLDNDTKIGTVPTQLSVGEASTVSLSWKPAAGSHRVTVEFTTTSGTVTEAQSATFFVAPAPETKIPVSNTSIESSKNIQQTIANYSPTTASTLEPIFTFIDSTRERGAVALENQIDWVKQKVVNTPKPGVVAGQQSNKQGSWKDTVFFAVYTLYLYVLTIVRFLVGNAGLFYPVVVVIFFLFMWKMLRRIRRP